MPSRTPFNHGDNIVSWFASRTTGTSIGCRASSSMTTCTWWTSTRPSSISRNSRSPSATNTREAAALHPRLPAAAPGRGADPGGMQAGVPGRPRGEPARLRRRPRLVRGPWLCVPGRDRRGTPARLSAGKPQVAGPVPGARRLAREIAARLLTLLASAAGPLPLGQLAAALRHDAPEATVVQHLCHLVYHHRIIVPLDDARITRDTPAWLPERQPT